jgi:hypothetical protein
LERAKEDALNNQPQMKTVIAEAVRTNSMVTNGINNIRIFKLKDG